MSTDTLAIVKLETCTAVQIFEPGFIDPVIEQIEAEARAEASRLDISTEASRKAIASLAYKVARSKTFIDSQRKALLADTKDYVKRVDREGARIWDRLELLQEEVRKPLTQWEESDKARIAAHESALKEIESAGPYSLQNWQSISAEAIGDRLKEITGDSRNWEEFAMRAAGVKALAKEQVYEALLKRERYDIEQAELARLRAEAIEREQKEREERIAREAREKAEQQAREREQRVAREAEAQRLQVEAEKRAAEQRAEQSEARRLAEQKEASRRAKEAQEQAERDKQAAIEAERKRVAAVEQRKRDEEAKREASVRIRRRVLGEISEAIAKLDIEPSKADVIASALANNHIPHVSVTF